jgi:hypothetical protein
MKKSDWKGTAELVGIAAIVASLVFVGFQLRQDEDIAELEGRSVFVANAIELARLFNDNEEVWRKGLRNDPLTESEQVTFNALIRVFYIEWFNRYGRRRVGVGNRGDPMEVPKMVALFMYQYPGLRRGMNALDMKLDAMSEATESERRGQFFPLVNQYLSEYDMKQPTLPEPDFIVF